MANDTATLSIKTVECDALSKAFKKETNLSYIYNAL
jgi:hypothetical protein